MGKKLYVGNLSYDVDSSALEQLFSAHGSVQSAQIISDRDTGQSKGFGFVEMGSDAEAQAAIAALNGQQHGGRALTVNEAKPKENRSGGGGGGGRGGYGGGGGGGGRGGLPPVAAGAFSVKLTVNGRSFTQPLTVKPDPREK
jgi:cold-inducible RNA-binding protein